VGFVSVLSLDELFSRNGFYTALTGKSYINHIFKTLTPVFADRNSENLILIWQLF
jgi:hypothetical protein